MDGPDYRQQEELEQQEWEELHEAIEWQEQFQSRKESDHEHSDIDYRRKRHGEEYEFAQPRPEQHIADPGCEEASPFSLR